MLITFNIRHLFPSFSDSLRAAFFQVSSIISTTGYATADFNAWPSFSKYLLLLLMFVGGCAGSTAGGIKVSRIIMMFRMVKNEIRRLIHPRAITSLRFEGKSVGGATSKNVSNYFLIYFLCLAAVVMCLSFEPFSFETNFSAAVSCFNNVGPASNYSAYSDFAKFVLSFAMLLGRLEIFPLIIALSPSAWSRNK